MQQIGFVIACVALVVAASQVDAFEYKNCDDGASKLVNAAIKGCEGAKGDACELKVGSNFNINTTFVTHNAFDDATIFMDVYEDPESKFIHVAKGPACELGIDCPSKADQSQSLALEFKIPAIFANLGRVYRLKVTSKARDEFCVEFPLQITN